MSGAISKKSKDFIKENPLIEREQFVIVWGFMILDFGLEKTELLVYAIIFAIYKSTSCGFTGSRRYLQNWCNAGKTTIDNALLSLEKKGLIIKEYKSYGEFTKAVYHINEEALPTCEMFAFENRYRDNMEEFRKSERRRALGLE